jgi:hypothetical protein
MPRNYEPVEEIIDEIQNQYARVLDNAGLNVADHISANIGFFNNSGKNFADPMKLGKTMIFFTRPNLNLRDADNIKRSRIFSYYRSSVLGCTLMRQLMFPSIARRMCYALYKYDIGTNDNRIDILGTCDDTIIGGGRPLIEGIESLPIVKSNFIPLLSNACVSTGNAKDIMLFTYETKGNMSEDKLKYAGGIEESLTIGEVTCEFEDMYSSPVMIMIYIWIMYMHYVGKAICDPEWAYIVHRIIDYTCSIYIFMLGTDNQTIIRWVKYGGCFPINIPFGAIQHSREPNIEELRKLSVNFAYNFMCPMDPVVLTEFNMLSGPSLYNRLVMGYGLSDEKANAYIGEHHISLESAADLLTNYGPKYEHLIGSNTVPLRRINYVPEKNEAVPKNSIRTGYEGSPEGEDINPFLINRANGLIQNNFYGVPYIVEGNKLMFL